MTPDLLPVATPASPVWLRVGTLFDGLGGAPLADAHLVYDAARIRFVGSGHATPPREILRPGQTEPDLHDPAATILPGLIDAHAHLFLAGGELDLDQRAAYLKRPPTELLAQAKHRLAPLVHLGIAGVRDAGDRDGVGLALSRLYAAGPDSRPLMPYLESPGAAIHHAGRYGSFMGDPLEQFDSPAACVAARVAAGADRIKLIPTGIINFKKGAVTTEPQMTTEEIAALVAAAKRHGRQTFAHASGDTGIQRAIDGGVDSVEHGFFIRDDQLARMRDRGIAWVPTFAPVQRQLDEASRFGWDDEARGHLRRILDAHAASLVRAHALGVIVIAGSDAGSCGVPHGLGLLTELELMERAGLPAATVLHAATGASAGRLGYREDIGCLVPGYRPRFIATHHTPLSSVANLRKPRTVVFDGVALNAHVDSSLL